MYFDVVTFIYKLLNLNLQNAFNLWTCLHSCVNWSVFVCGIMRLPWRPLGSQMRFFQPGTIYSQSDASLVFSQSHDCRPTRVTLQRQEYCIFSAHFELLFGKLKVLYGLEHRHLIPFFFIPFFFVIHVAMITDTCFGVFSYS